MRIGVFGAAGDPHTDALVAEVERRGVEAVVFESRALLNGVAHGFDGHAHTVAGKVISDLSACYLRYVIAPHYRPAGGTSVKPDPTLHLQSSYQLGWIETLLDRGVPVINPPAATGARRSKQRQLAAAVDVGLRIPKTRITNSAAEIRQLAREAGPLIHKPLDGGEPCRPVEPGRFPDLLTEPTIVQERIDGDDVRVTVVGDQVVSSVQIPSDHLDYRDDPAYRAGRFEYAAVALPEELVDRLRAFMRRCRLEFSGIDLIDSGDGYVFLEANSSPLWLDIERRTGAPITARLTDLLLALASSPEMSAHGKGDPVRGR